MTKLFGIFMLFNNYSSLLFYNPAYKKHTQFKCYVLTNNQIAKSEDLFLENDRFSPQQLSFDELSKSKGLFIVILAKNIGNKQAYGTLKCTVGNRSAEVSVIGLGPHMQKFEVWLIPVGTAILGHGPQQPQPLVEWKNLYAK